MTTDLGLDLAQAILGVDRLYRAQSTGSGVLDTEGLVAVPPADVAPNLYAAWSDAAADLAALQRRLPEIGDELRRDFCREMLESISTAVEGFRGEEIPYADRVERCLRVPAKPVPDDVMAGYREEMAGALRRLGYAHGLLGERVRRWEDERRVGADDVPAVLDELLAEARRLTGERVLPVPAYAAQMSAVGLRNVPFSAYCDFAGRQLKVNLDYVYTRPALKHLACHEAYPGHLVHMAVRQERAAAGLMPADAPLVVVNSASSAIFEGIGENGIHFLDWVEDAADELGMALNRLRSAARCNAALMIHQEAVGLDRARAYLLETCFTTPAWVESRLAFLTHKLRAPFIFAYWCGDMAVARVWRRVDAGRRGEFFRYLYYNMHTPATLDRHWRQPVGPAAGDSANTRK